MSKVKNIIRLNFTLGGEQDSVISVINNFEKTGRIFHREASLAERAFLVDLLKGRINWEEFLHFDIYKGIVQSQEYV